MLYIKDNIIKDSSLITLTINDKIVYNPSQELLEENGWSVYNESNLNQFINKRYIETTSSVFNNVDKSDLKDTIVFIKDVSKIYLNGNKYHCGDSQFSNYENNYGFGIEYICDICINNNCYNLSIPCAGYNDYSDKGWGTTNIGQFVSNDGEGYNVNIPNSTYEDFIGEEKSTHIGDFQFAGNTYPVYIPEIKEPEFIKNVTIEELNDLKNSKKLIPGQKYVVVDYKTIIDENIGEVVYQENEKHELIFTALSKSELDNDVTSVQTFKSSSNVVSGLEPTGDFELIAYKCDWDPDNSCYTEDNEYYKYNGNKINIDGETYYIWHKYENGIRLHQSFGKSTIATTSLDFECSIDNPYHIEYYINYDEINSDYQFEEPSEDNNDPSISDSISRIVRIDKPVYNYYVKMQACDWDSTNEVYGYDEDSWYEYNGDTIDVDGVTYFKWNKYDNGGGKVENACYPLTDTLYIDCSPENPYTPEMWITVDNELNNEYFDPTKTDIFCGIKESNLPNLVQEIEVVDREPVITKVRADLDITKSFDESQVVNALAFKTKLFENSTGNDEVIKEVDYETMHLYSGDTFDLDGKTYYIWEKLMSTGELVNGQYAIDEYGLNPQMLLTDKLYIDCSVDNPYNADYSLTQEGEVTENYQLNHFGDSFVEIKYFNNITNYIRFESNGWYVRCPELDQDDKFGWAFISNTVNTIDNSYDWVEGGGNEYGPFPAFMNTYDLNENDFFLTDTLDPQVGDSFCRNDGDELDTIDKVWGTIIEPEISCRGIYHMKDEFGNEAPYDFKHIQFEGLYTFGNETEDYSLNGFENKVYNNKIMKPIDTQYNRINFSEKNVYGNTIYPSVTGCVIDFSVKESLITKSELGLHVFDPTSFITPIRVNPLIGENKIISYKTTDEQIVNPKSDAFGDATIISNKYE